MHPRNNYTNNAKLSQWFPNDGYGSNIFPTKVRRTYGWLCPCGDYKSNRWFNTQRHIYNLHGSGEPIDSRTGETKAEKKARTSAVHHSGSGMFAPNVVIPVKPKELSENKIVYAQAHIPTAELESPRITEDVPLHTTYEDLYSMPFLEAQRRRVMELRYGVRIPSQSLPSSSVEINRFGKTKILSLGSVEIPGNIDSNFSGPNTYPLGQRILYYNNNSSVDYVDQLAPHDPAMALWQGVREVAKSILE